VTDLNASFTHERFTANDDQVRWFGDRVLAALPTRHGRILEVGCGDGSLLLYLNARMPDATLVGIDLSVPNIADASRAIASRNLGPRVSAIHADFLSFDGGRFDAIIAHSALQVMPTPLSELASTIHRMLEPGGRLIHATPAACTFNSILSSARRMLRAARSRLLDAALLAGARVLHPAATDARRRQALHYMYLPLVHTEDGIRATLMARGFTVIMEEPMPHTSWGQPKHRMTAMAAPR
jgi:2-polyprenyl-3-methyl-5-hydroxy-6-metoxy-1,4-benzoquinol methylase